MTKLKNLETYRGLVMAQETDSNDHMNVQFYTTKYDIASGQFISLLGLDFPSLRAQNLGFAYVEMTIKYIVEVLEDDAIHIETSVLDCANKVVTIKHEMKNSVTGILVSNAIAKWVLFDKSKRKAVPLSEEWKEKFSAMI